MTRWLLLIALSLTCQTGSAGVVSRDLFEPGDGLLTYDEVNHREWLDFSVSTGISEAELARQLSTAGPLNGFSFATEADVLGLARSANVHWYDIKNDIMIENTESDPRLLSLTDFTFLATGGVWGRIELATGLIATPSGRELAGSHFDGTLVILQRFGQEPLDGVLNRPDVRQLPYESFHVVSSYPSFSGPNGSYWLYRNAAPVPEPTTVCLTLAACLTSLRLRGFA